MSETPDNKLVSSTPDLEDSPGTPEPGPENVDCDALRGRKKDLLAQLKEAQEELKQAREARAEAEAALAEKEKEVTSLTESVAKVEADLEQLQREYETCVGIEGADAEVCQDLKDKIAGTKSRLEGLRRALQKAREDRAAAAAKVEEAKEAEKEARRRSEEIGDELDDVNAQLIEHCSGDGGKAPAEDGKVPVPGL